MFRTVALVSVAFAGASRIQVHDAEKAEWGSSCDSLQTNFRNRVAAYSASFAAIENPDEISTYAQARLMMRTYGIVRTMRRAESCSWVQDDNTEDMEQVREVVQTLLSGNPCASVARDEMQSGLGSEDELGSVRRALWILTSDSDDCDATLPEEEIAALDPNRALEAERDAEDDLTDLIDQMDNEEGEASFIETDSGFLVRLFRFIGIVFLLMFFAMACTSVMAMIGFAIGALIAAVTIPSGAAVGVRGAAAAASFLYPIAGLYIGSLGGLLGCLLHTFSTLLPNLVAETALPGPQ